MKLIKKEIREKTSKEIVSDMVYAFDILVNQKRFLTDRNKILSITITDTNSKHEKDLRHTITNSFFNTIHREYRQSREHINYLFVIEYNEIVSKGLYVPSKCNIHTHIVLNTSIPQQTIEFYTKNVFRNSDIYIEDITKRDDKNNYIKYLTKQQHILSDNNYNYKRGCKLNCVKLKNNRTLTHGLRNGK